MRRIFLSPATKLMVLLLVTITKALESSLVPSLMTKTNSVESAMTIPSDGNNLSLESLVDSRFKQLATDLQGQVDELKDKVVRLEATNNQGANKNHHNTAGKQKRQAKKGSSSVCISSSSLCTFYYPDHPDARIRKGNSHSAAADDTSNEMVQDQFNHARIGMPTSCKDLQLLGHKLNGFYSVKTSRSNVKPTKMETIYCDFQSDVNGKGQLESRIGVLDVKSSLVQFNVLREGGSVNQGERVVFAKQTLNVGNGFDWGNQIFRAPYSGTYFFSVSGTKNAVGNPNGSIRAAINILVNGNGIGAAVSSDNTEFGGFSCQVITKLNASDKVELFMHFGRVYSVYFTGWMLEENLTI